MSSISPGTPNAKVPQIFERLVAQGQSPTLRRTNGSYEFDIVDGGQWFIELVDGRPTIREKIEHPDCAVTINAADFIDIAEGRRNLITTFFQGRISLTGDLAFALTFRRLVPVAA
jgi:predicted lipid carrier protein YhbT